jgi:hypothetical protein
MSNNPKLDPAPASNTKKDPEQWVSGDEPMTGAQASYLKTLSEQVGDATAFGGLEAYRRPQIAVGARTGEGLK